MSTRIKNHVIPFTRLIFPIITGLLLFYILVDGFALLSFQWLRLREYWRFIILPISGYFVWIKRKELLQKNPRPEIVWGLIPFLFGCGMYVVWKITLIDTFIEAGIFITCIASICLFMGKWFVKKLFFPLFYLVFMTTILVRLLSPLTFVMQTVSAIGSSWLLGAFGCPVLRNGQFLRLPHLVLEVASACSGVSQLIALIAFALPLGILRHRSFLSRFVLVLLAIPLTILTNVIRIVLIAWWNYSGPKPNIHGPKGVLDLPLIYPLAIIILFAFSELFRRFEIKKQSKTDHENDRITEKKVFDYRSFKAPCIIGIVIMVICIIVATAVQPRALTYKYDLQEIPMDVGEWTGSETHNLPVWFSLGSPDGVLERSYVQKNKMQVSLIVARFSEQNIWKRIYCVESEILKGQNYSVRLHAQDMSIVNAKIYNTEMHSQKIIALSFFCIDSIPFDNISDTRKTVIMHTLRDHRSNGLFYFLMCNKNQDGYSDQKLQEFTASIFPYVKKMQESR